MFGKAEYFGTIQMDEQVRPEYFGSRTIRLSDPFSPLPLTPSTPLIGKTKLVLPPPGKFQRGILTENISGGRRGDR